MKTTPLYGAGRFVMHRLRELKLYAGMRRPGLRMAVLPSTGREMSSLLRGYNVAEELAGRGWNTLVLPAQLEAVQRRRVLRRRGRRCWPRRAAGASRCGARWSWPGGCGRPRARRPG